MKSGSRVWKKMDTSAEGNLRKCELLSQLIVHEIMSNVNFFGNTKRARKTGLLGSGYENRVRKNGFETEERVTRIGLQRSG